MNTEQFIEAYHDDDNDDVTDAVVKAHASTIYRAIGKYLYATDPEERVDGTYALYEACEEVLGARRKKRENEKLDRYNSGFANFGG